MIREQSVQERPILFSGPMVRAILEGRKTQTRRVVKPQPDTGASLRCGMYSPCVTNRRTGEEEPGKEVFGAVWAIAAEAWKCPYGKPGDRLWVREEHYRFGHWEAVPGVKTKKGRMKWRFVPDSKEVLFAPPVGGFRGGRHHKDPETPAWHKRLARFMPRSLSRITLEVVSVRVERLNEISEEDARAEGIERVGGGRYWKNYLFKTAHPKRSETVTDAEHRINAYGCPLKSYRSLWESINGAGSWGENSWVWVVTIARYNGAKEAAA